MRSYSEATADDLLRVSIADLLDSGDSIEPSRGDALELQAVTLELTSPLARLSRSETRGRVFSALGELCWYLSRTNETDQIAYYMPRYRNEDEGGVVHGGYGPRLFAFDGIDQVAGIIERLRRFESSRRAVIQIFDRQDTAEFHKDVPCTCTMQFLVRREKLILITHMRSNDAYRGLPHDFFAFTMLQELIARSLGVEIGEYIHMVGSFHLYEGDLEAARAYLDEGWQSTVPMPPMPDGEPWPSVERLIGLEAGLRTGRLDPAKVRSGDDPYWNDLGLLLAMFALWKTGRAGEIPALRSRLTSTVFSAHLNDKFESA